MKEYIMGLSDNVNALSILVKAYNLHELVRCKDCIHYRYYGLTDYPVSECKIDHCENPDEDWFCADGVREDS